MKRGLWVPDPYACCFCQSPQRGHGIVIGTWVGPHTFQAPPDSVIKFRMQARRRLRNAQAVKS